MSALSTPHPTQALVKEKYNQKRNRKQKELTQVIKSE